ncbi:MAG: aldehyde ferredoxin oxidoreductase family protein [Candidatus Bathyarchaeia archaeon]
MYGFTGNILRIDLQNKKSTMESLKEDVLRRFIGGRGIGAWILWRELPQGIDPLSPENKLVISIGPLAGTKALGTHRWIAQFKSPLTGTYFRSVGGGFFGAELKFAGYDALIIEGRADKPTYVYIHDTNVEFRDASRVWGMTTEAARDFLLEETTKDARMVMIGPAGENLVKISALVTDDMRTASRGGGGAVMGSKNLKAIVVKGSKRPEIFDEKTFEEAVREEIEIIKESPVYEGFHSLGTNIAVYGEYLGGCFPTYNYRQEKLKGVEMFRPENLSRYVVKHYGCYGCMVRCGKIFKLTKGPYAGLVWDFPEYETHWAFGGNLGNINIESITYANMLADRYGLDTISAGSVIGFAMELYERGIIGKSETDGLELRWGDPDIICELVRKIALRIGIGNILAEGVRKAAEIIGRGSEKYAMHVKGLELPAHDPRRAKAFGLSMVTSPIGASHTMGISTFEEFGIPFKGRKVDPFATEGKGEIAKYIQDETAAYETGVWCIFVATFCGIPLELYAKLLRAATGIKEIDTQYLLLVGERIFNLERAINAREGIDASYDRMPERITKEPILRDDTKAKGQVFEEEIMIKDYYKVRGWNEKGIPTKEKLKELGLEDYFSK